MNRKKFLKKSVLGALGIAASTNTLQSKNTTPSPSTYDKLIAQVGFNHLPNQEIKTMKTVLHQANTRGNANHGWLNSYHTFSFANYHNPNRMNFGVLRVLNDDTVAPGRGFAKHPHDNMEIISIPLEGDLQHKDSIGNIAIIKQGDVQVMSAGTGIQHSEYNKNPDKAVKFLQIWMFPNKKNVTPRYDQITLNNHPADTPFQQILSPNPDDDGVWVHQNAWFHLGNFDTATQATYDLKSKQNGVYIFVLEGNVTVEDQPLHPRDGFGIWDTDNICIDTSGKAKILLMDVPMTL